MSLPDPNEINIPGAQPPPEAESPRIGKQSKFAAGIPGVLHSLDFAAREPGLLRGTRALLKVNQKDGFDCQSCAWPNPDEERSFAEFCENGAKAVADEATTKRIGATFFAENSVQHLAAQSDHWLGQQGRLIEPMVRRKGESHYHPIGWDEAFRLIASELRSLDSPNQAAFYTSGRTSNEAAFLYQLFVRRFGTNNLPDCSNMCHESSGEALMETIGIGKGCVKLSDFELADAIFVIGQNPGTNHPRMLTALEKAKRPRKDGHPGAKIVSINPLPEVGNYRFKNPQDLKNPLRAMQILAGEGGELGGLWLQVNINGDVAVLKGIMKEMFEAEEKAPGSVIDSEFVRDFTLGFDAFRENLRETSWEEIEKSSGVPRDKIRRAAQIAVASKRIICCWAMGLTQHKNAVGTIQEVVNFLLLGGNIGRPGAGPCPVRGHSNVQGDRTMGISERVHDRFLDKLGACFQFEPPRKHGVDVVKCIQEMAKGDIRVFIGMGGNFLSATPDTEVTAAAMQRCKLTAHVSTKLNRSHLISGETALILPCLGRSEIDRASTGVAQFVTVEDSMGIVSASRGVFEPAGELLKSEPAIVAGIAQTTFGSTDSTDWQGLANDYAKIRDAIEQVIPGFERFNERIARDVFYLPNAARDSREFKNKQGKALFTCHPIPRNLPVPGEFVMMTIRSHDQFNTHIYGLDDRYRGIYNGRRVVFMNGQDIEEAGLQTGQWVDLVNEFGGVQRVAKRFTVAVYDIPRGNVATYFPEANVLVPLESVADRSNTPTSKFVIVKIRASESGN